MASKSPTSTPRIKGNGFATLEGGMDGGTDSSLIAPNQVSASSNLTMRGAMIKTRAPFANRLFTFDSPLTQGRFMGRFQDAIFYSAESGNSGFILGVGGKLFRIQMGMTNVLSEITPRLNILVTAPFAVPGLGSNVTVNVTSETPLTVGITVYMDSGLYLIITQLTDQVIVQYLGGAAHGTVPTGTAVLDGGQNAIFQYEINNPNADYVFIFQAENYAIVCGGQFKTIIYDGASARQAGVNELPPAVFGVYGWGRIWLTLNDRRTFVAGDIVYGPSGTPQNGFRDAILKITENTFLNEGGLFGVPNNAGLITSMFVRQVLDTSLGMGPIMIGTTNSIISCNAPVDRTTWKNITFPIQTISLLDFGPLGPWTVVPVNSDEFYRSSDGIRSFIAAQRQANQPGQIPISREVSPILDKDSEDLLFHCSGVNFDNRMLMTAAPYFTQFGTAHRGSVVINNDLMSNLRAQLPSAWEGVYSGIQVLKYVKGILNGRERAFAFVLNGSAIELWEILKEKEGFYDQYTTVDANGNTRIGSTDIGSFFETRRDDAGDNEQLKRLYTAELFIDGITDRVEVTILYRPDEYPDWVPWTTLVFCASVSQCLPPFSPKFNCAMWKSKRGTYAARVLLTTPDEVPNPLREGFLSSGYTFQFRFECSGKFRFRKFVPQFTAQDDAVEGACPNPVPACESFSACEKDWFAYSSYGVITEFSGTYTIPNGASSGVVTGLALGFQPTNIDVTVMVPNVNSEVLTVNATTALSPDGFQFVLSGMTDGPCYILSYTLKA